MIHHHRLKRDDFIIIPKGRFYYHPKGDDSSLSSLWNDFLLSSQRGRFIIIVPEGTIHHRPKGTIFLLSSQRDDTSSSSQRDDSSSSSQRDNFFYHPKGRFIIIVSLG